MKNFLLELTCYNDLLCRNRLMLCDHYFSIRDPLCAHICSRDIALFCWISFKSKLRKNLSKLQTNQKHLQQITPFYCMEYSFVNCKYRHKQLWMYWNMNFLNFYSKKGNGYKFGVKYLYKYQVQIGGWTSWGGSIGRREKLSFLMEVFNFTQDLRIYVNRKIAEDNI